MQIWSELDKQFPELPIVSIEKNIQMIRERLKDRTEAYFTSADSDIEWLLGYVKVLEGVIEESTEELRALNLTVQQMIDKTKSRGV